jgi:hypothetical protein
LNKTIQENVMKRLVIFREGLAVFLGAVMLVSSALAQASAPGAQVDGIKVHGHWIIVVKNPDGSVSSHHEFENSLFPGDGDVALAAILSRTSSVGMWAIELDGPAAAKPCHNGTGVQCEILEPNGNVLSGEETFENLTMQLTGTYKTQIVLSGTAKSTNGGQISSVSTFIGTCSASVLPSSCGRYGGSGSHRLTDHALTVPITIVAGQSINVTVTLSFS